MFVLVCKIIGSIFNNSERIIIGIILINKNKEYNIFKNYTIFNDYY